MNGELVTTVTPHDYVRLHGFYRRSDTALTTSPDKGSVDAAVVLHGLGGNFYSSRLLLHFSQTLLQLGISVVIVNTRGHDMISTATWSGRSTSIGTALENVSDCQYDIEAWADFLIKRGHQNVLLFGHSLGAIKSFYAQAHRPHPKIRCIIGLSATRLSYKKLIDTERGEKFRETIETCRGLIDNQQGEIPIQVHFPFTTWMTPQCYIDKYGPDETYNWINFIDKIDIPTLMVFGEKELNDDPAFQGVREELDELRKGWNPLTIEEVAEADHFYTSQYESVDDLVTRWLTR